jgi:hypothetical protein
LIASGIASPVKAGRSQGMDATLAGRGRIAVYSGIVAVLVSCKHSLLSGQVRGSFCRL